MKDYSGYYQIDNIYFAHSVGMELFLFMSSSNFSLYGNISSGVNFGNLTIRMNEILDQTIENNEKFVSLSPYIMPSMKFKIPLIPKIKWVTVLGGLIDIGGKIHLEGNDDAILQLNNQDLKSGWSGFRAHTGIELEF